MNKATRDKICALLRTPGMDEKALMKALSWWERFQWWWLNRRIRKAMPGLQDEMLKKIDRHEYPLPDNLKRLMN